MFLFYQFSGSAILTLGKQLIQQQDLSLRVNSIHIQMSRAALEPTIALVTVQLLTEQLQLSAMVGPLSFSMSR